MRKFGEFGFIYLILPTLLGLVSRGAASDLTIDALTFKSDSGRVYLELHFDLPRSSLTHVKGDSGWFGAAKFSVWIERDSISLARDEWRLEDLADNPEEVASGQRIVDARIYQMYPGNYQVTVSVTDSLSGTGIVQNKFIAIEGYPDERFSLSEIQLATHVALGNIHPRFDRGGFSIIPNPRRLYAPPSPIVYYLEIYPAVGDTIDHEYLLKSAILANTTARLRELPSYVRHGNKPFAVMDTFSVVGLAGDTYYFQLEVICAADTFSRRAKFHLYSPDSLSSAPVSVAYDSGSVTAEFEQVEFLLTRDEAAEASKMTMAEKALFLNRIWRRYDDDTKTPEVPLRKVFRMRVKEADDRWSNSRSSGHQTDRGRVYVIHGEPDDREIHTLDLHAKTYEIWTYNSLQGGAIFAFVDRSALGEFTLVHSTLRGEVSNPDWYDRYVIKSSVDTRK